MYLIKQPKIQRVSNPLTCTTCAFSTYDGDKLICEDKDVASQVWRHLCKFDEDGFPTKVPGGCPSYKE